MFAFEIQIYRIMTLIHVFQFHLIVSLFIAEFRDYGRRTFNLITNLVYYHTAQLIHLYKIITFKIKIKSNRVVAKLTHTVTTKLTSELTSLYCEEVITLLLCWPNGRMLRSHLRVTVVQTESEQQNAEHTAYHNACYSATAQRGRVVFVGAGGSG